MISLLRDSSQSNKIVVIAVEKLRERKWLLNMCINILTKSCHRNKSNKFVIIVRSKIIKSTAKKQKTKVYNNHIFTYGPAKVSRFKTLSKFRTFFLSSKKH